MTVSECDKFVPVRSRYVTNELILGLIISNKLWAKGRNELAGLILRNNVESCFKTAINLSYHTYSLYNINEPQIISVYWCVKLM